MMQDILAISSGIIIAANAGSLLWKHRTRRYLVFYKLSKNEGEIIEGNMVYKTFTPICQSDVMQIIRNSGTEFEKGTITNYRLLSKHEFSEWKK